VGNPGSTEPIDPSGTGNGIGFNRNYFDHGEDFDYVGFALSRIAQSAAKNRIHTERQTVPYTEREKGFWDRLLQECRERDLPVLSMRQAATMLFDHIADDGNPVPRVDVDRDGDGLPDGYQQLPPGSNYGQEAEEGLRGANFHHFRRQGPGPFFSIKWMGGIRPGRSRVRVWARGVPGDRLRITLTLYVYKHVEGDRYGNRMSTETVELPVALDSPGWKLYDAGEIDKHPNCYFNDMDVSAETASRTLYVSQVVIQ
jgi:hypothetical protein